LYALKLEIDVKTRQVRYYGKYIKAHGKSEWIWELTTMNPNEQCITKGSGVDWWMASGSKPYQYSKSKLEHDDNKNGWFK